MSQSKKPAQSKQATRQNFEATLEAILILEHGAVKLSKLQELFKWKDLTPLYTASANLNQRYAKAGFVTRIEQNADTVEICLAENFTNPMIKDYLKKRRKLPTALMETLAIVAYNQPVTKSDIQHIRGAISAAALKTLVETKLIETSGYKDAPGKPVLYRTTSHFLSFFSIKNLRDLPPLEDLKTHSFLK